MGKSTMRETMLTRLNKLDERQHNSMSQAVTERISIHDSFIHASTIGLTISRFPEVNTYLLIEKAWALEKSVVVPKCIHSTREMDFRLITSFDQLETVYLDLLEPIEAQTTSIGKDEIDLLIVPGVVFAENGYRIGFGGGYYDRYLKNYNGKTISLAFDCQVKDFVPKEQHDLPVASIITENRTIHCAKG
jgi:5-formyltetrahydrofolate cyclo-ligase